MPPVCRSQLRSRTACEVLLVTMGCEYSGRLQVQGQILAVQQLGCAAGNVQAAAQLPLQTAPKALQRVALFHHQQQVGPALADQPVARAFILEAKLAMREKAIPPPRGCSPCASSPPSTARSRRSFGLPSGHRGAWAAAEPQEHRFYTLSTVVWNVVWGSHSFRPRVKTNRSSSPSSSGPRIMLGSKGPSGTTPTPPVTTTRTE